MKSFGRDTGTVARNRFATRLLPCR